MLIEAEWNERKGTLELKMAEHIGNVLVDNLLSQKDGGNGFTSGRTMRKVASIPTSVFREWQIEFEKIGGKNQLNWPDDWRKFRDRKLSEHPEYRTVDKMLHTTPYPTQIIVK